MKRIEKQKGVRLHIIISSAIVVSMLLLAFSLTLQSYYASRSGLVTQLETNTKQLAKSVNFKIEYVAQSVIGAVRLLQMDPANYAPNFADRLVRLPELVRVLTTNPVLSSVYIGYKNGDFLLVRSLHSQLAKESVNAPSGTEYVVQSIQHSAKNQVYSKWLFYDENLHYIEQRSIDNEYFDPRERPWYAKANTSVGMVQTKPYVFYTTKEVGITVAIKNSAAGTVVGVDASIDDLSGAVRSLQPSPEYLLALLDEQGHVVGYPDASKIIKEDGKSHFRLAKVGELNEPIFSRIVEESLKADILYPLKVEGEKWYSEKILIGSQQTMQLTLLFAIPEHVLLESANKHLVNQLYWSLVIIGVLLCLGWVLGRYIAKPLIKLSASVDALSVFDFSKQKKIKSIVKEVNLLSTLTNKMANAIQSFQLIARELSRDKDLEHMLEQVSKYLVSITSSKAGAVYLYDGSGLSLATHSDVQLPKQIECEELSADDLICKMKSAISINHEHLSITPLLDRHNKTLGALVLIVPEQADYGSTFAKFVDEVSGLAETAIETRQQVESQQALLDAMIVLLADAIDAKSPYTAGHCERVPMLAEMILDAAESSVHDSFEHFSMTSDERREFRVAAWLHDCGKITSPEYVVDKATKLETLYNRIHEIRTRFEVLWRDAEIAYLEGLLKGESPEKLIIQKEADQALLKSDFEFVAKANVGGEFMPQGDIDRLNAIAKRSWYRHFDKRLGISRDERSRLPSQPNEALPVRENILMDLPEHVVAWGEKRPAVEKSNPENIWGFDMTLPDNAFNFGELYNLSIQKGTLTSEERFAINDHIVQTIKMLSSLPLPDNLKRVPDIAGNHHERMDGKGYPRRLLASELSVAERIMALADVFEALTAADRPYKTAKTLSESLTILAYMVNERHIDPSLFRLFLDSKIYLEYAHKYLHEEQMDEVNVSALMKIAGIET